MVQIVITLTTGSSWSVPADCNKIDSVDCYASAGSGAASAFSVSNGPTGGGGTGFSRKNNIPVTPLSSIPYGISAGARVWLLGLVVL